MSNLKKRTREAAAGTGSSKSSSESAFVGNEIYVNRMPDPPCEGKMLREAVDEAFLVGYKPTVLESRYKYPILEDTLDSGINFDIVDVMAWESPWVRLESTMPPSKRKKHADTDSAIQASVSSYYQHYQKKNKASVTANAILAAKHGRVAAADVTLPFESQLRSVPKQQQFPLYHRETVASTSTTTSVPSASAVPWLKRTEYMTSKDERSLALTSALISESIEQLDALAAHSVESPSSATTNTFSDTHMDIDSEQHSFVDDRDESDRLADSILGSPAAAASSSSSSSKRDSISTSRRLSKSDTAEQLPSPFEEDATKVLRAIEASFDAIASRSAIVHPSKAKSSSTNKGTQNIRRSSSAGMGSQSTPSQEGPHIVEEWDIFPNELVWSNSYLAVQTEIPLPQGELLLMPLLTHEQSLLKPHATMEEERLAHQSHIVPNKKKEIVALYAKSQEDQDDQMLIPSDELTFQSNWEAEATSLLPGFDTMGSFVFVLGSTQPYDADEDEESGVVYEGADADQTVKARRLKNQSLAKARVGTATFKNIDSRVHLRPPTAESRAAATKLQHPESVKMAPVPIPSVELHLRQMAADTLKSE